MCVCRLKWIVHDNPGSRTKNSSVSVATRQKMQVCRVCLSSGIKLFMTTANQLEQKYQILTGDIVQHTAFPPYLCFECAALVHKSYVFRKRCLHAQNVFTDLLNTFHQVTLEQIDKLDRTLLKSPYDVHHNAAIDFMHIAHNPDCTEIEIKDESKVAEICKAEGGVPDLNEIKTERSDDEYHALEASVVFSSDEDEPLALRRTKLEMFMQSQLPDMPPAVAEKKRKKKKKDGKKKKEKTDEDNEIDNMDIELKVNRKRKEMPTEETPREPKKRGPKPGSRGDDAELEQYCTIVKLSVEEQVQEIEERRTSSNYTNAPYKCHTCYKGFVDTEAFRHHILKHDPAAGDEVCPICRFRFASRRALQKHAANHEKKYQCRACPYISKTTTQAKQHQKWHAGVTYKCSQCDEVLTKWTSYLSHVRIKHPSEHICSVCGYSFVSKLGLAMHRTMMHKDIQMETKPEGGEEMREDIEERADGAPAPYCVECDVQFTTRQAWKRHMVTSAKHTTATDFGNGCRVCGESFSTSEQLRLHHRQAHARKRPKNYGKKPSDIVWPIKCEHCAEEIPNAREYWTHFRRAHPDKKYPIKKSFVCEICGKAFRGNAFLTYHKRTHSTERAYACAQCPKTFFNRTNLLMHEKTHSDHRPYPCTVCFKAFKLKGALDRHFRSHTGLKPYECEFCGKAFGQSNSRKLHVRTVHLKQPAPYVSKSRLERRRQAEAVKSHAAFPYTATV